MKETEYSNQTYKSEFKDVTILIIKDKAIDCTRISTDYAKYRDIYS